MDFDLKVFRAEKLNLTQKTLSELLKVEQFQISRWENNPSKLPFRVFLDLCKISGMTPDQLVEDVELPKPDIVDFGNPYKERDIRISMLNEYCEVGLNQLIEKKEEPELIEDLIEELRNIRNCIGEKPVVAVMGKFDSGKSRLINCMTGIDAIVCQWTPTTKIATYIKHIDNRPDFINESVWIFKNGDNSNKIWNFRRYRDEKYCKKWMLDKGGFDILKKYGTYDVENDNENNNAHSALVFMKSPILKACDLIDLPGFGSSKGKKRDEELKSQDALKFADLVIYMSKINGFIEIEDIEFISMIIREKAGIAPIEKEEDTFDKIIVVASQAHIESNKEVRDQTIEKRTEELFERLSMRTKQTIKKAGGTPTYELLRKQFVTYSLDNRSLREDFNIKLKNSLMNSFPPKIISMQDAMITEFKKHAQDKLSNEINKTESIMSDYDSVKKQYEKAKSNRPKAKKEIKAIKESINKKINSSSKNCISDFDDWWTENITPPKVSREIENRNYNRKEATERIGGIIMGNIQDSYQSICEENFNKVKPDIGKLFKEYENQAEFLAIKDPEGQNIPFDYQGLLKGAFGAASVLGGLTIWASTLGNLGWYIIASKGVSLLSAIGISTGGTAAATAFLATIGGPITVAAGIAIAIAIGIKSLFGESWQKRLSKQLYKIMKQEGIKNKSKKVINKFWEDAPNGIEEVTVNMDKKIDDYIHSMKITLDEHDPKKLKNKIDNCKEYNKFFEGLPWISI